MLTHGASQIACLLLLAYFVPTLFWTKGSRRQGNHTVTIALAPIAVLLVVLEILACVGSKKGSGPKYDLR